MKLVILCLSQLILCFLGCQLVESKCSQRCPIYPCNELSRGNKCYQFVSAERTWNDAKDLCKKHGSELVTIETKEEMDYIANLLSGQLAWMKNGIWIGATDKGKWKWTNGQDVTYSNWAPGNPGGLFSGDCALLSKKDGWKWKDASCNSFLAGFHYTFICQYVADVKKGDDDTLTKTRIGVGVGVGLLLILLAIVLICIFKRKCSRPAEDGAYDVEFENIDKAKIQNTETSCAVAADDKMAEFEPEGKAGIAPEEKKISNENLGNDDLEKESVKTKDANLYRRDTKTDKGYNKDKIFSRDDNVKVDGVPDGVNDLNRL